MPSEPAGFAFLILLRDLDDATGLARLLEDVRLPSAPTKSLFLVPPVSGLDFFADEDRQGAIDGWWAENVPRDFVPVYMLMHEEGLADWIKGLDGLFYVGVQNPGVAQLYAEQAS